MSTPFELFATSAFKVRRRTDGAEFLAVKVVDKFVGVLPDRPHFEDVERNIEHCDVTYNPETGEKIKKYRVEKVKDKAKCFSFTGEADSDVHGGTIRVEPGDYIIKDGDTYFAVPDVDRRSRKPIFSERFIRL